MRVMYNARRVARRLEQSDPYTFAGAATTREGKLLVRFAGPGSQTERLARVRSAGIEPDLADDVEVREVRRSLRELREAVRAIDSQRRASGLQFDLGLDIADNDVKILSQQPERVQAAISGGTLRVPDYVTVELAEPIVVTADVYGGRAYNNGSTYGCTTGFVVFRVSDSRRGITSAGHCESPDVAEKYNNSTTVTSLSATSNISLTHQQSWAVGSGMDIGWYTVSTIHNLPPAFWNDSSAVTVRDVSNAIGGDWLCKFGRRTGVTCGYADDYLIWHSDYAGYFVYVRSNASYPLMNDTGDSGGPVWLFSDWAIGTVHARQGTNMLVDEIQKLYDNGTGVDILVVY